MPETPSPGSTQPMPTGPMPTEPAVKKTSSRYTFGVISALVGLIVLPEIFGSIAIILGAYVWKWEQNSNRGLYVIILGIACMIIGLYFTSLFGLYDLIP